VSADATMALLVMLPLVAAIGAFVWPRWARPVGMAATLALLFLGAWLVVLVSRSGHLSQAIGGGPPPSASGCMPTACPPCSWARWRRSAC
jgi:hypothetical protein